MTKKVVQITIDSSNNSVWIAQLPMNVKLVVTHLSSGFSTEQGQMTYQVIKEWDEDIKNYCYPIVGTRTQRDEEEGS